MRVLHQDLAYAFRQLEIRDQTEMTLSSAGMPSEQVVEQCVRAAKVPLAQAFDGQSKIGQAVPCSEFEDAEHAGHAQAKVDQWDSWHP